MAAEPKSLATASLARHYPYFRLLFPIAVCYEKLCACDVDWEVYMRGFPFAVPALMLGVLVLGLVRLFLPSGSDQQMSAARALAWADCLTPVSVQPGTTLTLVSLDASPEEFKSELDPRSKPASQLLFRVTGDIEADPVDPAIRASIVAGTTLAPGTLLRVSAGEFVFRGAAELELSGAPLLLRARDDLRFGSGGQDTYVIRLTKAATIAAGTKPKLPVNLEGVLPFDGSKRVSLKTLDPIAAEPFLYKQAPILVPVRALGEKGPAALSIEVNGQKLEAGKLDACAASGKEETTAKATSTVVENVGLSSVAVAGNSASMMLNLPSSILPDVGPLYSIISVAVASTDGSYAAHGGFTAVSRWMAGLIAVALTALIFGILLKMRNHEARQADGQIRVGETAKHADWKSWFAGLFVSEHDNDPSLSLFQVFFWTVITVWGFIYTFTVTGSLIGMSQEMMILLGIAGAGSVAARWMAASRGTSSSKPEGAAAGVVKAPVEFWQMLSTGGRFDLLKLQLLLFTLLIGTYVVARIADSGAFPVLDTNTLLLLGVSQGVYIGGKFGGTTVLARAQEIKLDRDLKREAAKNLEAKVASDRAELEQLGTQKTNLENKKAALGQGQALDKSDAERLVDLATAITTLQTTIKDNEKELTATNARVVELNALLEKAVAEMDLK